MAENNGENPYSILVRLSKRKLYVYKKGRLHRVYPVAVGKPSTPTPRGDFTVINRQEHPGGQYGDMWMGLSVPHIGIHGTDDPATVGMAASHGCVRMHNADATELAYMVPNGTPVRITE